MGLDVQPGETVLDLTVNRGGHSLALCERAAAHGRLIGIDADNGALQEAGENLKVCPCPVTLINGNFRDLARLLDEAGVATVDVVLADLGLSSEQLSETGRGFSFQTDEPLVMTLDPHPPAGVLTAHEVVNFWREETLADVIFAYGEERFARRIARAIVTARATRPLKTTGELVAAIKSAIPTRFQQGKRHFATKTFQALRIAVNDELSALQFLLPTAWSRLDIGGRIGVITFHGLEAKLVKFFFRDLDQRGKGEILTKHAIRATRAEISTNPRSRGAQLRIIKKLS